MASGPSLSLQIGADASGLKTQLGQASAEVQNFGRSAQDTASQVEAQVDAQVKSLSTAANYKKELRSATMEVQNLTMALRQMTDEQRNGVLGQAVAEQLNAAKQRAAELKDMVGDLNTEIKNMASDSAQFDGLKQGFGVLRDTMSAFVAIQGMAGGSTAEFEQTMKDLATVVTSFNALIGITNALQKQSALMQTVASVQRWAQARATAAQATSQEVLNAATTAGAASTARDAASTTADTTAKAANTVATNAQTAAVGKLTIAQRAFNLAAKANPYVLLASALLTVGAGLLYLFNQSHKATEQMKKQKEAAEKLRKEQEKFQNKMGELGTASGNVRAEMARLTAEYGQLQTKAEKQRWIEENKSRFHALGLSIEDVKTAEDIFVKNTGAVVAAMIARAVAAKKAEQAANELVEKEKERAKQDREFDAGSNTSKTGKYYRKYKRGMADVSDDEARRAGVRTKAQRTKGVVGAGAYARTEYDDYTDEEIKKINENRNREAAAAKKAIDARYEAEVKAITEGVEEAVRAQYEADKKLYSLVPRPKLKTTGAGTTKKDKKDEEEPESGSLADLKKQREALLKIQQNKTYQKHKTNADEVAAEIKRLDKMIADEQFTIDFNTDPAKVSLEAIEQKYDEVYAKARGQKLEGDALKNAGNDLSLLNQVDVNRRYSIGLDIKPAEDSLVALSRKADEIFAKMGNPSVSGSADFSALKAEYDNVVNEIQDKKVALGIDTKPAEDSVDDLQARIVALLSEQNDLKLSVQTDETKQRILEIDAKVDELRGKLSGQSTVLTLNTEPAHASLNAIEQRIEALKKKLKNDVTLDIEGQKKIVGEIKAAENELKQHKITIGLETDPTAEQLKSLTKQTEEALKPKKQSSFSQAVGQEKPAKNDYSGQLRAMEEIMNANDSQISKLEEQKAKYEELGQTGVDAYQQIIDKLRELNEENAKVGEAAKEAKKNDKQQKKSAKNWEHAADAVDSFGSALSSIGDATNSPELNVAGVIAQTLANLALSASQAISQSTSMGPWGWIAFSIAAMAQLAAMVAQVNSLTGGYATGGIIPGNSISGDRLTARVNSGEMILNST